MEYTVKQLAQLAGVSERTLRFYDKQGLLCPARNAQSGYRLYGPKEVDRLQQILFYKARGFELEQILSALDDERFDELAALRENRQKLLDEQKRITALLANIDKTIQSKEKGIIMNDAEKFEGFKKEKIAQNEARYGRECREKYGDAAMDESNRRLMDMSKDELSDYEQLGKRILDRLAELVEKNDPEGEEGQALAKLHKQWLCCSLGKYDPKTHMGIAQMYTMDPRFAEYYNAAAPGGAEYISKAIQAFAGKQLNKA